MLETIRELALEHMNELVDGNDLRARADAAHYLELALSASLDTDAPTEQRPEIVVPDVANLRTVALDWALERGEIEFGLQLLVALEQLWLLGYVEEGQRWYRLFLERADTAATRLLSCCCACSRARRTSPATPSSPSSSANRASRSTARSMTTTALPCCSTGCRSSRSCMATLRWHTNALTRASTFTGVWETTRAHASRSHCSARLALQSGDT